MYVISSDSFTFKFMNKSKGHLLGPSEEATFAMPGTAPGMLQDMRVVEVSDGDADYCGLLLAGMGASVVKIEPADGSPARRIGPFLRGETDTQESLHFWHYNRAKQSVSMDLAGDCKSQLESLLESADVLLDSSGGAVLDALGLSTDSLRKKYPRLIHGRLTAFGDEGPWRNFKGSDLIHLALGGVVMNCGYDADPFGEYDLPPIAPQVWQSLHIAGEQLAVGIMGAIVARDRTGQGQIVSCSIHEAVAKCTELDLMSWVMRRVTLHRQTCRHAAEITDSTPNIGLTKDGRWFISLLVSPRDQASLIPFLGKYGMAADLQPTQESATKSRDIPGTAPADESKSHALEVIQRFVRSWRYENMPWIEAQLAGLLWAPLRKAHENAKDPHWALRGTFAHIEHEKLGRSFCYPVSKWLATKSSWQIGQPAPTVGQHNGVAFEQHKSTVCSSVENAGGEKPLGFTPRLSPHEKPFALQGVRILDFSWFLASAGGTRFLTGLGAETLKVEWKGNPDTRFGAMAPVGGRAARDAANGPLPGHNDPSMGGQFNNKNAGKLGVSLNIQDPRGLALAKQLILKSDIVAEGFSPGVLERLGLGYEVMKKLKPEIIYVQQSGMGSHGMYGRFRTVGPIAAAFSGVSEMSGLPEPAMPAGWGYSYLDWIGAYGFAQAILGALHHRNITGEGQRVDSSQCEAGIFVAGPTILEHSATKGTFSRYGNRSPYKQAAPHGIYRTSGNDRWIAIACFDESDWVDLTKVAQHPEWSDDPRFSSLQQRMQHQDELDSLMQMWTSDQDGYELMYDLQKAGVSAGVCQTAQDRCDRDPQLSSAHWLTEVTGSSIGRWPVAELPFRMSDTPPHMGGIYNRGAPLYGEDNQYVFGELLGMSTAEIDRLIAENII